MNTEQEQLDRLPPHSIEAEMCLLGSLMLAGDDRVTFAAVKALVSRDCFYQPDHAIIFETLCQLHASGKAIDAVIVREALARAGVLEEVGGVPYLAQLLHSVPVATHAKHYAAIIAEKATLRRGIELCSRFIAKAYAPATGDVAQSLVMDLGKTAVKLATSGKANVVHRLEDVVHEVVERKESGQDLRIPTGLRDLDRVIGGLRRGGKTIVGAKPGMGKSLLIKQLAQNIAGQGIPFGIVSIEESRHKIGENVLANQSGIPNNRIAFSTLDDREWQEISKALPAVAKLPVFIVDSARRLSEIAAAVHLLAIEHQCQVIAVDHLHIIDAEMDENRERQVSTISAELKWVWKELNVAGIEAAQLNRTGGKERPTLASLRDSGSLEQDGDTVILLHREDYYKHDSRSYDRVLEAIIAKNKDGAPGTVPLHYDGARQRISDYDGPAGVVGDVDPF
ncbi:MAG: replicative DNA helicase [Bacillota bacterium]